jgi:hypothetical protein
MLPPWMCALPEYHFCEHGDDLVHVPVSGGPRDAVVTGECPGADSSRNHPQTHHRLPKAGQRPAAAGCAAPSALGEQQFGKQTRPAPSSTQGADGEAAAVPYSNAELAALRSICVSAGSQDRSTMLRNIWRSSAGWLRVAAHSLLSQHRGAAWMTRR